MSIKELGRNTTELAIGSRGGANPHDINGPQSNKIMPPDDLDRDGQLDHGIAHELSDDLNASLVKGK